MKYVKKVLKIVSVLILLIIISNFVYADVIDIPDYIWQEENNRKVLILPIVMLIIGMFMIDFHSKMRKASDKDNKYKKHKVIILWSTIMVICIIFMLICLFLFIKDTYKSPINKFYHDETSSGKSTEDFHHNLQVYKESPYRSKIEDIIGLLDAIEEYNNTNEKKIKVIYNHSNTYESNEIYKLKSNIDEEEHYYWNSSHYNNLGNLESIYIDTIDLTVYAKRGDFEYDREFIKYEGKQKGIMVKTLINKLIENAKLEENIVYYPGVSYNAAKNSDVVDKNQEYDKIICEVTDTSDLGYYIDLLNQLSSGIDNKHVYYIVLTYGEYSQISGITINYNSHDNPEDNENFISEKDNENFISERK